MPREIGANHLHRRSPFKLSLLFTALTYLLSAVGGSGTAAARGIVTAESIQTLLALERGETALISRSTDYIQALTTVLEALPARGQDFARNDITAFLRRAPIPGADFNCSPEFVRYRAQQELGRIRDKILNVGPDSAEPQFCYSAPFAVDLASPLGIVDIYGYDFDTQPLELFILNTDNTFEEVSSALKIRTHYHLAADLSRVKLSPRSQTLSVVWGHIVRYSVSLIQPTTPLCVSQIEEVPAGKEITYAPFRFAVDGNSRSRSTLRASAVLNYSTNKLDATVCSTVTEHDPDSIAITGCAVEYVYTTAPERIIEAVFTELQSVAIFTFVQAPSPRSATKGTRDGAVARWTFDIPNEASAARTEPMVTVELNKIRIVATTIDNCLPAIAYMEATRTKALTSGTLRRLRPQSKAVPQEILKSRPRFAPD